MNFFHKKTHGLNLFNLEVDEIVEKTEGKDYLG
jgi:hypothetical protein